jgi:hypothetical protein
LLKGQVGDEINVLMAACAWNLRKWLIATAIFLFSAFCFKGLFKLRRRTINNGVEFLLFLFRDIAKPVVARIYLLLAVFYSIVSVYLLNTPIDE